MAYATKTIRNRIENRAGLAAWYEATRTLYNQVVAFYFDLYQAHPDLLEIGQSQALSLAEKLTHKTKQNPEPMMPLTIAVPALLRRAAINTARGAYQSFWSNRKG